MSSTEELVGLVLAALHPRLRERCTESKMLAVLEEGCGAYDIKTLRTLDKETGGSIPRAHTVRRTQTVRRCPERRAKRERRRRR